MKKQEIIIILITLITIATGFRLKKTRNKLFKLIMKPQWFINIIVIIGFTGYIIYTAHEQKTDREKNIIRSLKKAVIALVIAIFAHLGLAIAPFWLVFVLSYYMEGWI